MIKTQWVLTRLGDHAHTSRSSSDTWRGLLGGGSALPRGRKEGRTLCCVADVKVPCIYGRRGGACANCSSFGENVEVLIFGTII